MESALAAGENVDVADGALRTRPGTSLMSSDSLPAGEVMALENVRFPTNEVSYLVAQVKHSPSPPTWETNTAWEELTPLAFTNPPYAVWTGRIGSSLVWDAGNGRILKFAGGTEGGYTNDLWTYDPETDTWALLYPYTDDAPTVGGPGFRAGHRAVYVPAMEAMVVLGGGSWVPWPDNDYEDAHLHIWDCQTDTWTSQATTGETPLPRNHFVAILRGNTIIIPDCAAYNNLAYYSLDLSTWVWTRHEQAAMTEGTPIGHHHQSGVYDPVNDALIMVGGYYGDSVMSAATFVLDFATETWTRKADCPVIDTDEVGIIGHQAVYCSGKMLITGDSGYWETYSDPRNPLEAYVYDVASDSWTAHAWDTAFDVPEGEGPLPPRRGDHAMCVSDTGETFIWAGNTGTYSDMFHSLWKLSGQCSSCDGSTKVNLFASPDQLPTTTGQFESIYEFTSVPGICTFGVLNDRVVITEGIAAPPLVWAGAMADNASDWPHPKAVLIAQDGERFYDVSSEVCDKDPDTVAQVGGIRTWGAIYICTDMPEVEGFYFDMKSPNTGATGTTTSTFHSPMQITEADHVARQDLKGTIVNWVQDSGATGHFTNAGGETITVGPGNDRGSWNNGTAYVVGDTVTLNGVVYWCILSHTGHTPPNLTYWRVNNPDIVPGIAVDLGDGEFLITAVTNGGVGAAEVTLAATHANATVDAAYGLSIDTNGLTVNLGYQTGVESWSKTLAGGASLAGYSIRIVVPGSEISSGGDHVQLTLKGPTVLPAHKQYASSIGTVTVNRVSIVERDGATANGTTTPTLITFPGLYGTHTNSKTLGYPGLEVTTDVIPFTVDETKDYIVTLDIKWATSWYVPADAPVVAAQQTFRAGYLPWVAGTAYIKDFGWGNDGNSAQDQTVTGFTEVPFILGLEKLTITGIQPVSPGLEVAHTTNAVQIASGTWESLDSVAITQVTPGSSTIYHAISFDARASFWVFVAAAWRQIVRNNSGTWQYNNSATTTPSWQNATVNSLLGALRQAFADSHNQTNKAAFEAITQGQWSASGGFVPHVTTTLDFAVGMQANSTNVPLLSAYEITYGDTGQAIIEGFQNGAWTGGAGWTDNTIVNGSRLGQSGSIMYAGPSPFKADYHVVDQVPGYWFRLLTNGTSPDCAITRIRYKAPCQPLANIGDGQPDTPLGFIYQDASTSSIRDFTVEVSDNVLTELSKADIPMQPEDFLFVGYLTWFNEIEITPYTDNNQEASVLSAAYWNGEAWAPLAVKDGTIGSAGNTLAQKGRISWTLPTDWKTSIPFNASFNRGYWVRLSVSGALTSTAAISEVRIYGVPDALKKHKFAATFQNRIVLGNRPDAPDQVDISRADEEYGFTGPDSASYRVGGTDSIQCAISAWNGLLIGKTETWHQLIASSSGDFQFESVEAARHVPINSQCVVKAPVGGFDYGDRYGLFFVNRYGAFVSTGLHVDSLWNTSRGKTISDVLNWWDTTETPRLDLDYLHLTCGEYWPARNWIVWAVPMILSSGSGPQASNNRLIVYDLTLGAWLPPFTISAASLCTAYHYNPNAPGKLGDLGLYAGDYQGRVIRLFGPGVTSDLGSTISGWVETGWLDFGSPEYRKLLRMLSVYGNTADDAIVVTAFADGDTTASTVAEFHDLSNLASKTFALEQESHNVQGRFFKFRIAFNGASEVFGLQIATSLIRDWGAL
jgi:hypothetical protein